MASGGCQPTELPAFDSEGLHRSARRVCRDRGRHSPWLWILRLYHL